MDTIIKLWLSLKPTKQQIKRVFLAVVFIVGIGIILGAKDWVTNVVDTRIDLKFGREIDRLGAAIDRLEGIHLRSKE